VSIPCYLWTDAIQRPDKMTATTMGVKGADKLNTGIKLLFNQAGNALESAWKYQPDTQNTGR
jgi:anaerobic dimethyl sulfoxide reductase subunit A